MKAYQCSECEYLQDYGETCGCIIGVDPRPNYREKSGADLCKENFRPLEEEKRWHKKFSWE